MRLHTRTLTAYALLALLALATSCGTGQTDGTYTATAQPAPQPPAIEAPTDTDSDHTLANLFAEHANMDNQSRSLHLLDQLFDMSQWPRIVPDYYGGEYLDDTGRLTLLVLTDHPDAQAFIDSLDPWIQVRPAVHSYNYLQALSDHLFNNQAWEFASSWGPDTIQNTFTVDLIRYNEEEIARFRREVSDSPAIVFTGARVGEFFPIQPVELVPELEGLIELVVAEKTTDYVVVHMINNSPYMAMTGYEYALEHFVGGKWQRVPSSRFFPGIGLMLEPSGYLSFTIQLHDVHHLMPAGQYRIRKSMSTSLLPHTVLGYFEGGGIQPTHTVFAYFDWDN